MLPEMMIDADICIKLGGSDKYHFLEQIVPMLVEQAFMHKHAFDEVLHPHSVINQLSNLIKSKKIIIVNATLLPAPERAIYDMSFLQLSRIMIDPRFINKNRGEVCSLAYAKAVGISIFATDEMRLQTIVDR